MSKTHKKTDILKELRLILCGWCFALALWVVPKNDPEGLIVIRAVRDWALLSKLYIIKKRAESNANN